MADPTQEKFWRIKSLKCYPKVHAMLIVGKPAMSVALYIQDDRGEYTDIKVESLEAILNEYRRSALGSGAALDRIPHLKASAAREFTDRLAELKLLHNLLDMQLSRIDDAFGDEQLKRGEKNTHIDKMFKEIRDTANLIHQIKMDLNLTGSRDLGTLTIAPERMEEMRAKYGDAATRPLDSALSRGRMLAAMRAARQYVLMQGQQGQVEEIEPEPEYESVEEAPEVEVPKPKARRGSH